MGLSTVLGAARGKRSRGGGSQTKRATSVQRGLGSRCVSGPQASLVNNKRTETVTVRRFGGGPAGGEWAARRVGQRFSRHWQARARGLSRRTDSSLWGGHTRPASAPTCHSLLEAANWASRGFTASPLSRPRLRTASCAKRQAGQRGHAKSTEGFPLRKALESEMRGGRAGDQRLDGSLVSLSGTFRAMLRRSGPDM